MHAIELLAWIVSLDRVPVKLSCGGKVAAVGCGLGPSMVVVARAYPRSRFLSFAADPDDLARARQLAAAEGVADRVTFELGLPADIAGTEYDLVAHVDGLSDGAQPVAVVDAAGKRVGEHQVETNGQALVECLRMIPEQRHVCIEEGTRSAWLYEILAPHAQEMW